MEDRDFIDFKFGDHWASEFNLVAVSSGDRYSPPVYGSVNPNTTTVAGKTGIYKWKSQIGEKVFNINIAFDNINGQILNQIKEWLHPFKIDKLTFKEEPYKYYWVALNSEPELNFVPFLEETRIVNGIAFKEGIYKGEFNLQFVCFENYGYSDWQSFNEDYDYQLETTDFVEDLVIAKNAMDTEAYLNIKGNTVQTTRDEEEGTKIETTENITLTDVNANKQHKILVKGNSNQVTRSAIAGTTISGEVISLTDVDSSKQHKLNIEGNSYQETRDAVAGTTIVSTEPITLTDVDSSKQHKILIEGNSYQETRSAVEGKRVVSQEINLTDVDSTRQHKIDIKGCSYQNIRSGKNKLKITNFEDRTIEGVTVTAKYGTNGELEYISAKGNSTTDYTDFLRVDISNLPAGDYIVNGLGTNKIIRFVLLKQNDTEPKVITSDTDVSFTQDSSSPYTIFRIDLYQTGAIDIKIKPMIRQSSITDSTYEPYGVSPSPDYPSEVESCGDNVNLLPIRQFNNQQHTGLTLNSNSDGSIVINGTTTEATTITISSEQFNIHKGVYTFSIGDTKIGGFNVFLQKSDYTDIVLLSIGASNTQITKELEEITIRSINIYINKDVTFNNYIIKPKLEKGYNTPYSPSGQGCINEVICNKNLWNLGDTNNHSGDKSFPLESGKHTLSFKKKRISNTTISNEWVHRYAYIKFYDENNILLSTLGDSTAISLKAGETSDRQIISFTAPENTVKAIINFSNNNGDNNTNTEVIEIQLEKETATDYEEYQSQTYTIPTQQPMRSVGDYRDGFVKINNKWYERHYIERIIFDGTETWSRNAVNSGVNSQFYLAIKNKCKHEMGVSSHFKNGVFTVGNYFYVNGSTNLVVFPYPIYKGNEIPSIDEWKAWLTDQYNAGTPVYVDYVLVTPTDIECTEEQIKVLNQLQKLNLYQNVTNIYSTDESAAVLDLNYNYVSALPSIETPSEVRSAGNGKNLIITTNSSNYTITVDGAFIEEDDRISSDFIKLNSSETNFMLSAKQSLGFMGVAFYNTNKEYISRAYGNNIKELKVSIPSDTIYVRVFFETTSPKLTEQSWLDYEIKLEEGTVVTDYTLPGQGLIKKVINNKNLFPINISTQTKNGVTLTKNSDNSITLNGTSTTAFAFDLFKGSTIIKAGEYWMSYNESGSSNIKNAIGFLDRVENNMFVPENYWYGYNISKKLTVTKDFPLERIYMWIPNGAIFTNFKIKPQLEKNTQKTDYIANQLQQFSIPTQQPMRSIGDIKDVFVKINNKWYERHYINRYEITGDENITLSATYTNTIRFSFSGSNSYILADKQKTVLSNYFIDSNSGGQDKINIDLNGDSGDVMITVPNTLATTVEAIKIWLQEQYNTGTPIYVDYILTTPIELECTTEQTTILNELQKLNLYQDITYIYDANEIAPTTNLTYNYTSAMPSLETPSEIYCCGDNINLVNENGTPINTYINNDGVEVIDNQNNSYIKTILQSNLCKHYVMSYKNNYNGTVRFAYYNGNTFISREISDKNNYVFTVPENCTKIDIRTNIGTTTNYRFEELKIEKGSIATKYSFYNQGNINEIIGNKNFVVTKDIEEKTQGTMTYYCKDGAFYANGTNTNLIAIDFPKFKLPKGDYIYYVKGEGQRTGSHAFYVVIPSFGGYTNWPSSSGRRFTITDDTEDIYIRIFINPNCTFTNSVVKFQIEKASNFSDFIERESQEFTIPTQQPMRSVEDIKDTFVKINGKWYERHYINRIIFDGTTNKFIGKSGTINNLFFTNAFGNGNIILPSSNGITAKHLNNYFTTKYSVNYLYGNDCVGSALRIGSDLAIGFGANSETNTVELANAWLQEQYNMGRPMYVDYLLKTPTDLLCTTEQSEVLEKLQKPKLYQDTTHIYSTDETSPINNLTYNYTSAMPSTETPSAINSCGDNINLFNKEQAIHGQRLKDGENAIYASETNATSEYIEIEENTNYFVSNFNAYHIYDKDYKIVQQLFNGSTISYPITTPSKAKYMRISTLITKLNDCKLIKGNTNTLYTPYGQGSINEIITNKNIYSKQIQKLWFNNAKIGDATVTERTDNSMIVETTARTFTQFGYNQPGGSAQYRIKLKPNTTYTLSIRYEKISGQGGFGIGAFLSKNEIANYSRYIPKDFSSTVTFTTDSENIFFHFRIDIYYPSTHKFYNIQLEEGTIATDFIENQSQTFCIPTQKPFRKIGTKQDYFMKIGKKWYERHLVDRVIFNGSEAWSKEGYNQWPNLGNIFSVYVKEAFNTPDTGTNTLCNYYKGESMNEVVNDENLQGSIANYSTYGRNIWILDRRFTDLTAFKNWIKECYDNGSPLYVDYRLKESVDIECTEEQIQILEELIKTQLYEGTIHIYNLDMISPGINLRYNYQSVMPSIETPTEIKNVNNGIIHFRQSNKNLVEIAKGTKYDNVGEGVKVTFNDDGSITLKGKNTSAFSVGIPNLNNIPMLFKGKTYTQWCKLEGKIQTPYETSFCIAGRREDSKNILGDLWLNYPGIKSRTVNVTENSKMSNYALFCGVTGVEFDCTIYPMIYEGSEVLQEFIPYQGKIFDFPLAEGQKLLKDSYFADDGIHHVRKQIVLDGTEEFGCVGNELIYSQDNLLKDMKIPMDHKVTPNIISNFFRASSYDLLWSSQNKKEDSIAVCADRTNNPRIYSSRFTGRTPQETINNLKEFLTEQYEKGEPVILEYELEKEIVESYTKEQEAVFKTMHTYSGTNYIYCLDEVSPLMSLSYIPEQDVYIDYVVNTSNLLNDSAFYYDNNINKKSYYDFETGNAATSGISEERPTYLYNAGTTNANLNLTFDLIIPAADSPLIIKTESCKFTDNGVKILEEVSSISISDFSKYKPFLDIYDGNLDNWQIEIDSNLCEIYVKHKTDKNKIISLNKFNDNQSFLSLTNCNFVDYMKPFPTLITAISNTAIENTVFNKLSVGSAVQNYRLKNVDVVWQHTYL